MDYTDFVDNCEWLRKRCELLTKLKINSDNNPVNQAGRIVSRLLAIEKDHIQAAVLGIHEDFARATNLLDEFSMQNLDLLNYDSFAAFMTSLVSRLRVLSSINSKYKYDFELIIFIDELAFSSKIVFGVIVRSKLAASALKDKIIELYGKIIHAEKIEFRNNA